LNIIEEKIKKTVLTKTEKKIADYFLENMNNLCLKTATDLASAIKVSDTSIIRFIRMLGFAGYSEFHKKMKEEFIQQFNEMVATFALLGNNVSACRKIHDMVLT